MAKQTLDTRLNMNLVAVCDRLLWGCVNLDTSENYPSDYASYDQYEDADKPKSVHSSLIIQKFFDKDRRVIPPTLL
jgi:hypothetical protein